MIPHSELSLCENCQWFIPMGPALDGHCHRMPPPFPCVDRHDFCGEFKETDIDVSEKIPAKKHYLDDNDGNIECHI